MKKGLRKILNDKIKRNGYISINNVHQLAKDCNHKESCAERELRPSRSPNVEALRNEKGHNIGYKWIGAENDELKGIDSNVVIEARGIDSNVTKETKSTYPSRDYDQREDFKPTKKDLLRFG